MIRKHGSRARGLFAPTRLAGPGDASVRIEFIIDGTDAKEADRGVRESEDRSRAVAALVPDLLWEADPSGTAARYNRRWFDYTGQTPEEAAGDGWLKVVHPDDRERSGQLF